MTYSNPIATIASIGSANTPIPVTIESDTEPTVRPAGTPLQVGDIWYDQVREYESIYVLNNNLGLKGWQAVGGENYIKELAATITPSVLDLPIATTESAGIVRIGNGLSVNTTGLLSVDPNETFQTIAVNGTATLHTIITGASVDGVAINASAGEITAQWLNIGKNPTTDVADSNYDVSLRTSGNIVTHNINAGQLNLSSSITTPNAIVTNLNGPRQGVVYKLVVGDGMTFEGQASTHIGGTVGNDYNTNVGTIGVNATVMRTTGDQALVGDLSVNKGVGPGTANLGTVSAVKLILSENFASTGDAGTPTLGYIANINSQPYWGNGVSWQSMLGGGAITPYALPIASATDLGGIKVGSGLQIDGLGVLSTTGSGGTPYTLPVATETQLGGIKVGTGLAVTLEGVLSNTNATPYTLPAATTGALGGVKVGTGLAVTADGTLSATAGDAYTLPQATDTVLGGVRVGDSLTLATDATIGVPLATPTTAGAVIIGEGITVTNGTISVPTLDTTLSPATSSTLGGIIVGGNLSVAADGTTSISDDVNLSGKITAKNHVSSGASAAGYSANFATGNVKLGRIEVVNGNDEAQDIETVKDVKLTGNVYPASTSTTNTVGTETLPFDAFYGSSVTFGENLPGNTRTVTSTTFNDYEKGTWTGTLDQVMESGTPTQTFAGTTTATGQYERIGNHVFISISFPSVVIPGNEVLNTPGNNGIATVTGLPFNASSLHNNQLEGEVSSVNMLTDIQEISNAVQLADPYDGLGAGAGTTGFMRLGCIFTAGQSYVNFGLGGTERVTHYDDNYFSAAYIVD